MKYYSAFHWIDRVDVVFFLSSKGDFTFIVCVYVFLNDSFFEILLLCDLVKCMYCIALWQWLPMLSEYKRKITTRADQHRWPWIESYWKYTWSKTKKNKSKYKYTVDTGKWSALCIELHRVRWAWQPANYCIRPVT